jgi:hypothetical protein
MAVKKEKMTVEKPGPPTKIEIIRIITGLSERNLEKKKILIIHNLEEHTYPSPRAYIVGEPVSDTEHSCKKKVSVQILMHMHKTVDSLSLTQEAAT